MFVLRLRMNIVAEYDCFINAINYLLKTTNIEDQCVPIAKEASLYSIWSLMFTCFFTSPTKCLDHLQRDYFPIRNW